MTRFEVQRCVGNTIEVLGIYETKEDMLAATNRFALQYACQSGIINGVSGKPDENGRRKSGEIRRMYCPPLSSRCDILLGLQSGEHVTIAPLLAGVRPQRWTCLHLIW